jgi:HNH endonuclease
MRLTRVTYHGTEALLRATVGHAGEECLIWPYCLDPTGYGKASVGGISVRASRAMCIFAHGDPPTPKHEHAHSCGNRACINPNHLRWDTKRGNASDRARHGTENRGERHGNARLTADDIRSIRSDDRLQKVIAAEYGISATHVSQIKSIKKWGHI